VILIADKHSPNENWTEFHSNYRSRYDLPLGRQRCSRNHILFKRAGAIPVPSLLFSELNYIWYICPVAIKIPEISWKQIHNLKIAAYGEKKRQYCKLYAFMSYVLCHSCKLHKLTNNNLPDYHGWTKLGIWIRMTGICYIVFKRNSAQSHNRRV